MGIALTIAILAGAGRLGAIGEAAVRDLLTLLASGVLSGVLAIYCLFTALRLMSVARIYTLHSFTPLLAAGLGRALFGESVNGPMAIGIGLTSLGVVLVQVAGPAEGKHS